MSSGRHFKNTYELVNLTSLKSSLLNKLHIFQCVGKICCVEFQRVPLKFYMIFIQFWKFKSSQINKLVCNFLKCFNETDHYGHHAWGNSMGLKPSKRIQSPAFSSILKEILYGHLTKMIFNSKLKFEANLFSYYPNCIKFITTKFCTCHDSHAVMPCAKFVVIDLLEIEWW